MYRVFRTLLLSALLVTAAGGQAQDKEKGGNKQGVEEQQFKALHTRADKKEGSDKKRGAEVHESKPLPTQAIKEKEDDKSKEKGADYKSWVEGRRCAYLGQWGSFHLIETGGSAVYFLGNVASSADLHWTQDDADYFYYEPSNGDPVTTGWAFSRTADACGMYLVCRHDGISWQIFERVRAWGRPGSFGSAQTTSLKIDQRVEDLETDMKKVKQKLQIK